MAIKYKQGNILNDTSRAIVIPVNTLGIAGAGLARQWALKHPQLHQVYAAACRDKKKPFKVGTILPLRTPERIFLCFPTKIVPQRRSDLEWIEDGLYALKRYVSTRQIRSIAIPALGCGLGGLPWEEVKPLIESYFGELTVRVNVYPPRRVL